MSPVELFFDLVFGFAFTEVTIFWAHHTSWAGLGRGLLVLAVLWWVWASFAWLTNTANAEADSVLAVVLFATAGVFVLALAVPSAFGADRVVFGVAFFAVIAAFVGLYAQVSKGLPDQFAAVVRMSRTMLPAAALIFSASFVPLIARPALWFVAFVVGMFGPNLGGLGGWRVYPAHFAERHGLILLIAVGESLSAIGFTTRAEHFGAGGFGVAVLGLLVAASFWLAYFDFASSGIRSLLAKSHGIQRTALARDIYTYAHLPMVVGILLFALAMRRAIANPGTDLAVIPAVALCCGNALYLVAFVSLRWRVARSLGIGRPIAALAFCALTPAARFLPAIAAIGLVATVWLGLHTYELVWWRDERVARRSEEPS